MSSPDLRMGNAEWAMLAVLSLLWGGSFVLMEMALASFSPLAMAAIRVTLGAIVLTAMVAASGLRLPRGPMMWGRIFLFAAVSNAVPFTLIGLGQREVDAGTSAILVAVTPLMAAVLAHLLTRDEKLSVPKIVGLVVGFLGVAVLVGPEALIAGQSDAVIVGELMILAAAFCYAVSTIAARWFKGEAPIVTGAAMLLGSTILTLPIAAAVDLPFMAPPTARALAAVMALGVFSTGLAYILYFRILKRAGGTNVVLVTFLNPVTAMLLAALFLGEAVTLEKTLGFGLVLAGLAIVDGRLQRRLASLPIRNPR